MKFSWTELAFTLGNWGRAPLTVEVQKEITSALCQWAAKNNAFIRLEIYRQPGFDAAGSELLRILEEGASFVRPVIRLEPRSDRFREAFKIGVREVIFETPASRERGSVRFLPDGVCRSPDFARQQALMAICEGITPEIALSDITRARELDVLAIIEGVETVARAQGVKVRWRLADTHGLGYPFGRKRRPRALKSWAVLLKKEFGIDPEHLSVQSSDLLGLGLANSLACFQEGIQPVTSLFGLGAGSGWTATETMLFHVLPKIPDLHDLIMLRSLLIPTASQLRDDYRPLSASLAYQVVADTTPEKMSGKIPALLPYDPQKVLGITPEPLLTSLSGHAGLLYLIHRHYPQLNLDTEDPRVLELYAKYEEQFIRGRMLPISWEEMEPEVRVKGIL